MKYMLISTMIVTFIMVYTANATIANVYTGITRPMLFPFTACCFEPAPIGGRNPGIGPGYSIEIF